MKLTVSQLKQIIKEELAGTFTLRGAEVLTKKYNLGMTARSLWEKHGHSTQYDVEHKIKRGEIK